MTTVYLVQRDNCDGLYLFTDEEQAAEYAALFDGADTATATVLTTEAARRLIEQEREDQADEGAVRYLCADCLAKADGPMTPTECDDDCDQETSHAGPCDPAAHDPFCDGCGRYDFLRAHTD